MYKSALTFDKIVLYLEDQAICDFVPYDPTVCMVTLLGHFQNIHINIGPPCAIKNPPFQEVGSEFGLLLKIFLFLLKLWSKKTRMR